MDSAAAAVATVVFGLAATVDALLDVTRLTVGAVAVRGRECAELAFAWETELLDSLLVPEAPDCPVSADATALPAANAAPMPTVIAPAPSQA